jgi:membrane associated rhomboid family serine protease
MLWLARLQCRSCEFDALTRVSGIDSEEKQRLIRYRTFSPGVMRALQRAATVQAAILGVCVLLAWIVEVVDNVAYGGSLDRFGIQPRSGAGLWGILAAPLLHFGWVHLASNTGPFIVLGWLVLLRGIRDFVVVTVCAVLIGGLGVWVFGAANSVHVGASGVIFGYLGCLLARGYFERSIWSIVLAIAAAILYGSVLWGLVPGQRGISWEGHLFGLVGGVAAARLLARGNARASRRVERLA